MSVYLVRCRVVRSEYPKRKYPEHYWKRPDAEDNARGILFLCLPDKVRTTPTNELCKDAVFLKHNRILTRTKNSAVANMFADCHKKR
jgi:hypothetical protein